MIKRDKRNIGKKVRYLPGHTMFGRTTVVTGFRGDCGKFKRNPYVTTTDGNTTAGHLLEKVKEES